MTPELKAEQQRQSDVLAHAINSVILTVAKTFEMPMMNALAGALVTTEAQMLASVADAKHRKTLRKAMDRERPRALAEALQRKPAPANVVVIPEKMDA